MTMKLGDTVQILANNKNHDRVGTIIRISTSVSDPSRDAILDVAFSNSVHDRQCYYASEVRVSRVDIEPYHFPHQAR